MDNPARHIANLLYRYAECIDGGRLADAAALFRHARIHLQEHAGPIDAAALLALWQRLIILYPDGTPRTQHVISNPIIELDETGDAASARSRYTVYQATPEQPPHVVACGRYHDRLARMDGAWRFTERRYFLDLAGDLREHLRADAWPGRQTQ